MEKTQCFWCENEFEYLDDQMRVTETEDFEGNMYPVYEAFCPTCDLWSVI